MIRLPAIHRLQQLHLAKSEVRDGELRYRRRLWTVVQNPTARGVILPRAAGPSFEQSVRLRATCAFLFLKLKKKA